MIKNQGNRKEEASVYGQFQKGQERLWNAEGDQVDLERGVTEVTHERSGEENVDDHGLDD
jgi:hypothetical protein